MMKETVIIKASIRKRVSNYRLIPLLLDACTISLNQHMLGIDCLLMGQVGYSTCPV